MNITDLTLILKIKETNCEDSLKELIHRHSRLCYDIFYKYLPAIVASGTFPDDAIGEKDYLIYKSAISFNPAKDTKFSTWLGNQIRYNCLTKIKRSKPHFALEEEEVKYVLEENNTKVDFSETKDYVLNILEQLKDKRVRKVFEMRYFSETPKCLTWDVIGKAMSLSSQTAINLHTRGKSILKRKMNKDFRGDFI